jgi:hypothetical protein
MTFDSFDSMTSYLDLVTSNSSVSITTTLDHSLSHFQVLPSASPDLMIFSFPAFLLTLCQPPFSPDQWLLDHVTHELPISFCSLTLFTITVLNIQYMFNHTLLDYQLSASSHLHGSHQLLLGFAG